MGIRIKTHSDSTSNQSLARKAINSLKNRRSVPFFQLRKLENVSLKRDDESVVHLKSKEFVNSTPRIKRAKSFFQSLRSVKKSRESSTAHEFLTNQRRSSASSFQVAARDLQRIFGLSEDNGKSINPVPISCHLDGIDATLALGQTNLEVCNIGENNENEFTIHENVAPQSRLQRKPRMSGLRSTVRRSRIFSPMAKIVCHTEPSCGTFILPNPIGAPQIPPAEFAYDSCSFSDLVLPDPAIIGSDHHSDDTKEIQFHSLTGIKDGFCGRNSSTEKKRAPFSCIAMSTSVDVDTFDNPSISTAIVEPNHGGEGHGDYSAVNSAPETYASTSFTAAEDWPLPKHYNIPVSTDSCEESVRPAESLHVSFNKTRMFTSPKSSPDTSDQAERTSPETDISQDLSERTLVGTTELVENADGTFSSIDWINEDGILRRGETTQVLPPISPGRLSETVCPEYINWFFSMMAPLTAERVWRPSDLAQPRHGGKSLIKTPFRWSTSETSSGSGWLSETTVDENLIKALVDKDESWDEQLETY